MLDFAFGQLKPREQRRTLEHILAFVHDNHRLVMLGTGGVSLIYLTVSGGNYCNFIQHTPGQHLAFCVLSPDLDKCDRKPPPASVLMSPAVDLTEGKFLPVGQLDRLSCQNTF